MLREDLDKFCAKPSMATAIRLHRLVCNRRDELKKEYDKANECLDALKDFFGKETRTFRTKYENLNRSRITWLSIAG